MHHLHNGACAANGVYSSHATEREPAWLFPWAAYSYGMLNSPEVKQQTRISHPHTLTAGLNSISLDFLQYVGAGITH